MSKNLNGTEIEEWFKDFARKSGILKEDPFRMEEIIRLFDIHLNYRLNRARKFIGEDFVNGVEWIDNVIKKQSLPEISEKVKIDFSNRLADLVMGTDTVLQLKDSQGKDVKIAVDVTTNAPEVPDKLKKIRGYSSHESEHNKNENIPAVRSALGVDKHLIILLERTKNELPSHEKLLDAIYAFAKTTSKTRAVDLTSLDPKDRYNWRGEYETDPERLWKKYTQAFNAKSTAVLGLEVAKHALRENHTPKAVLNMLTYDPQYRIFLRRDNEDRTRADQHAQGILVKAQAELEQFRVKDANQIAEGISRVLAKFGQEQADGSLVFEGNTLRFTASPSEMSVQNIQSGAAHLPHQGWTTAEA